MLSTTRSIFRHSLPICLLLLWLPLANAKPGTHEIFEVTGSVIKNHDGDTIKLHTTERGVIDVRLSGADTPETGQAYWKAARGYLRSLVSGKPVTVRCYKTDKYEREVCHVTVSGVDANLALIQNGYAWYAHMFSHELNSTQQRTYPDAEVDARKRKLGLWADPDPMPPWECRKLRKARQKCR